MANFDIAGKVFDIHNILLRERVVFGDEKLILEFPDVLRLHALIAQHVRKKALKDRLIPHDGKAVVFLYHVANGTHGVRFFETKLDFL